MTARKPLSILGVVVWLVLAGGCSGTKNPVADATGNDSVPMISAAPTGPSVRHYTCYNTGPFGMTARLAAGSTNTWIVTNDFDPTAAEPFKTRDIDALMHRRGGNCVRR